MDYCALEVFKVPANRFADQIWGKSYELGGPDDKYKNSRKDGHLVSWMSKVNTKEGNVGRVYQ